MCKRYFFILFVLKICTFRFANYTKINQIDQLGLSEKAKRIFAWKFFAGESFADWPGAENRKELYEVYQKVFNAILDQKKGMLLF